MKKTINVLIIKEEIANLEDFVKVFENADFQTRIVSNVSGAMQFIKKVLPDVIFCDLKLSNLDNFLTYLQENSTLDKTSLIFISSQYVKKNKNDVVEKINSQSSLSETLFAAISMLQNQSQKTRSLPKLLEESIFEPLIREEDIHNAIKNQEFEIYYQPKVSLKSGRIVGCEALLRWNHPIKGIIIPNKFIPLAEKTGAIIEIGEYVFNKSFQQVKEWQTQGFPGLKLAVNVSGRQLIEADFEQKLIDLLSKNKFDPQNLELDLKETVFLSNQEKIFQQYDFLKLLGIRITLDDFGTGYSCLNYLQNLSIDSLKISPYFMVDVVDSIKSQAIVKAIIEIAKSFNLEIIAEGIETIDALDFCTFNGCDYMQGYLYSRPLAAVDFGKLLKTNKYLYDIGQ